jgi:hypothetical protein
MATQRTFTAEETQKKFDSLPLEVKELLYSAELTSIIQKAGEKNKLHFDQMGRLEMETTNVLLGFTDMPDYAPILMKGLEIDQVKADAIVQDMNELLFNKIRDAMKITYEQNVVAPVVVGEKSVMMPSAVAAASVAPVMPAAATINPAPTVTTPAATIPPAAPLSTDMQIEPPLHETDIMLTEATVSLPAVSLSNPPKKVETPSTSSGQAAASPITPKVETPPAPLYKADPYREPIE